MVKVKRHKRQKPKPPNRDLQKVVAMLQGIRDRDEKLHALRRVKLDADIIRMRGNLASVPVPHVTTMENAIRQMERDLKELARK